MVRMESWKGKSESTIRFQWGVAKVSWKISDRWAKNVKWVQGNLYATMEYPNVKHRNRKKRSAAQRHGHWSQDTKRVCAAPTEDRSRHSMSKAHVPINRCSQASCSCAQTRQPPDKGCTMWES